MSQHPRKIWEKGMPLSQAIVEYSNYPNIGDSPEKRHFRNLNEPPQDGDYDPHNPDFYKYTPKEPWFRESTRNEYKKQFCEQLCNQLEIGNLIAIGITEYPNEVPEIIPEKLFMQFHRSSNYGQWDNDIFGKYKNVRIYDPRFNLDGSKKKSAFPGENLIAPVSGNTGGRPSTSDPIQIAFRACVAAGKIDFGGSQIDAVKVVRTHVRDTMPEEWGEKGSGFSEKAIGKHISAAFNAEKARRQSSIN